MRAGNYYEICKDCFRSRGRKYYQNTREHQLQLVKIRVGKYKELRRIALAKIKNVPCSDCKKLFPPWVLDFDHRNRNLKSGDIGHMFINGMWNIDMLEKEMVKCDLVCANCHRMRTYNSGVRAYDPVITKLKLEGYRFLWENMPAPR